MGLVYRALWNDDRADLHSAVASTFRYWVGNLGLQVSTPLVLDPFKVEVGEVMAAVCHAALSDGKTSLSVSVSTLCQSKSQSILVEADLETGDSHQAFRGAISELVRDLVDDAVSDSGRPRGEVVDISVGAQPVEDEAMIKGLSHQIDDPSRTVALVLAMYDPLDFDLRKLDELQNAGVGKTEAALKELNAANNRGRTRADYLANLLAGVGVVKWVPQNLVTAVQRELDVAPAVDDGLGELDSEDWRLSPGRMRLYPVGRGAEDRSRTYHESIVRSHPSVLVDEILSTIEPGLIGLRLPVGLLVARRALEAALTEHNEVPAFEVRERELQEVRELVVELRENLEIHRQLLDESKRQNDELTLQLVNYQLHENYLEPGQRPASPQLDSQPLNVSEAISRVRENEMRVEIPDEAVRGIERLDTGIHARGDAREVWRGLLALHWYAKDQQKGGQYKDFAHWCKRSRHAYSWSAHPQKLAMNESKSVKRDPQLRSARECPISSEIEPSGIKLMYPHLKISTQTQHAPRLYFYDDTLGTTGKIHVGFIGPHDLMPNSTTD